MVSKRVGLAAFESDVGGDGSRYPAFRPSLGTVPALVNPRNNPCPIQLAESPSVLCNEQMGLVGHSTSISSRSRIAGGTASKQAI